MGTWNLMGGRKHHTVKDYDEDRESDKKLACGRVAVVVFYLVIIGTMIYSLASDPGALELAKSLVTAIWNMLCNIANACSDFIKRIIYQTSG